LSDEIKRIVNIIHREQVIAIVPKQSGYFVMVFANSLKLKGANAHTS